MFLCVGEALQLAKDFCSICEEEFPAKHLAEFVCQKYSDPHVLYTRQNMVLATKYVV